MSRSARLGACVRPLPAQDDSSMRVSTVVAGIVVLFVAAGAYVLIYGVPATVAGIAVPGGGTAAEEAPPEPPPTLVVLATAAREDVAQRVEVVGDVVARESVVITAPVAGRVQEIAFADGQDVESGDLLVRLDPGVVAQEVRAVEATAEQARQEYERAASLAAEGAVPRADALDLLGAAEAAEATAASAREALAEYEIRAPFAGRVGLRSFSVGGFVQPGEEVVALDTVDPIDVRFTLPERYLGQVAEGSAVTAVSPAYPDEAFEGEVALVDIRVDPALRTVAVEASVPNPGGRLLPGMLMNVDLTLGVAEDAVVVPSLAVQVEGPARFVYREADGAAERVEVVTGQRLADLVEVVEGVAEGDRVVVEGFRDLVDGGLIEEAGEEEAKPSGEDADGGEG